MVINQGKAFTSWSYTQNKEQLWLIGDMLGFHPLNMGSIVGGTHISHWWQWHQEGNLAKTAPKYQKSLDFTHGASDPSQERLHNINKASYRPGNGCQYSYPSSVPSRFFWSGGLLQALWWRGRTMVLAQRMATGNRGHLSITARYTKSLQHLYLLLLSCIYCSHSHSRWSQPRQTDWQCLGQLSPGVGHSAPARYTSTIYWLTN